MALESRPDAYTLLEQEHFWWSAGGDRWPIIAMSPTHRDNVMSYLLRKAHTYERAYTVAEIGRAARLYDVHPLAHVDRNQDAMERRASDPRRWIRSRPLYHSLFRSSYPLRYAADFINSSRANSSRLLAHGSSRSSFRPLDYFL